MGHEKKCGQAECLNVATHRMFWPGSRPLLVCQEHRLMAMGIADCIGFELVIEPNDDTGDLSVLPVPAWAIARAECKAMIERMTAAKDLFYSLAVQVGWHSFVEFAGLMAKYIELVERAYEQSGEFIVLPLQPHDAEYLLEKLDGIFGPSAAITLVPRGNFRPTAERKA